MMRMLQVIWPPKFSFGQENFLVPGLSSAFPIVASRCLSAGFRYLSVTDWVIDIAAAERHGMGYPGGVCFVTGFDLTLSYYNREYTHFTAWKMPYY